MDTLDSPDFILFALDPEQTPFSKVQEAALKLRQTLDALGLESYPKTSGATGIHVFVPLQPRYSYADTRRFAEVVGIVISTSAIRHSPLAIRHSQLTGPDTARP